MWNPKRFQSLTDSGAVGTNGRIVKQGANVFPVIQLATGLAAFLGLGLLYFFSPGEYSFYPQCWVHSLTGLSCPGCGSLRALHALLHGNVSEALRFNGMLIASLPLFTWMAVGIKLGEVKELVKSRVFQISVGFYIALWIAFGIGRNLPS